MRDNFAKRWPDRFKESDNFIIPKAAIYAINAEGRPDKEDVTNAWFGAIRSSLFLKDMSARALRSETSASSMPLDHLLTAQALNRVVF